MLLNQIRFGSLIAYCPYGKMLDAKNEEKHSVALMHALKDDNIVIDTESGTNDEVTMSDWVGREVKRRIDSLPFKDYFKPETILVPIPRHGKSLENELWVPFRIGKALNSVGFGKDTVPLVVRAFPIRKASTSPSGTRPTAQEQYDSMIIESLTTPQLVVLVDDVVTTGASLLAAASRLVEEYPNIQVSAFAAMRTQSSRFDFEYDQGECEGTITLQPNGWTIRSP